MFRQAALALSAVITDPARIRPLQAVPISCRAVNDELLLVEWLDANAGRFGLVNLPSEPWHWSVNGQ